MEETPEIAHANQKYLSTEKVGSQLDALVVAEGLRNEELGERMEEPVEYNLFQKINNDNQSKYTFKGLRRKNVNKTNVVDLESNEMDFSLLRRAMSEPIPVEIDGDAEEARSNRWVATGQGRIYGNHIPTKVQVVKAINQVDGYDGGNGGAGLSSYPAIYTQKLQQVNMEMNELNSQL